VFVSAFVYYTASYYSNFHSDLSNFVPFNGVFDQGIVYSSDISLNSCYKINATPASGPFTLSTFSINSLATSIYEPSSITFTNDISAWTAVDII